MISAIPSTLLLVVFFHPWIVVGFVIDAVLLWLVLGEGMAGLRSTVDARAVAS